MIHLGHGARGLIWPVMLPRRGGRTRCVLAPVGNNGQIEDVGPSHSPPRCTSLCEHSSLEQLRVLRPVDLPAPNWPA